MSNVLFDVPGPKARARHRLYTVVFIVLLVAAALWVVQRLHSAGALTPEVFNDTFQNNNVSYLFDGLLATLRAAVFAIVGAVIFGAVFAVGRLSDHRFVRLPCAAVIEFFRAVPLVLLILIIYFSIKDTLGTMGSLVAALILYNGSVLAEVFRAGINAVAKGQSEAAYAIGMRKTQVMSIILIPQAVRFMLPAIISSCVIVLKDTSLGAIIVYEELVRNSRQVTLFVPDGTVLVYATAAAVFIIINYSLSRLAIYLERRLSRRGQQRAAGAALVDTGE